MFDSHCHLDFQSLQEDLKGHLERAREKDISAWFVPGCNEEQWESLGKLASLGEGGNEIYLGVGQHPYWSEEVSDLDWLCDRLVNSVRALGAVAVGEIGLDKGRGGPMSVQERLFEAQLSLADELSLPAVLHQVGCHEAFLRSLKRVGTPRAGAVVHGFSGALDWGEALVRRGLCLGIGPAITRQSRVRMRAALPLLPLDRLVLETDAPDQRTFEGGEVGVPLDLVEVCSELAKLRDLAPSRVSEICENVTRSLFQLPPCEQ